MRPGLNRVIAAPVQNIWYGVNADGYILSDAEILYIAVRHNRAIAQNLECSCSIDGLPVVGAAAGLAQLTWCYFYLDSVSDSLLPDLNEHLVGGGVEWPGHSSEVLMRSTNAGTVDLECWVRYGQL